MRARYSAVFSRLSKLYLRLARAILGVDSSTSGTAALVRLGWMPIDYLLAYRACIWYMKVRLGLADGALSNRFAVFFESVNNKTWAGSVFYKPSHNFVPC